MNAKHLTYCLAASLVVGGIGSAAQAAWVAPTGGWQLDYEASSGNRPDQATPAWTNSNYQFTDSSDSTGWNYSAVMADAVTTEQTLYMANNATSASGANRTPYYSLDSGAGAGSATDKITVDFRFRLVDPLQTNYQWGLSVSRPVSTGGTTTFILNFNLDHVQSLVSGNLPYQGVTLGTSWHDARLLIDVAGNTASLYLDGNSTATYTTAGTLNPSGTSNRIWIGDGQGSVLGKVNLSYLRLTNDEFASVVPEPASMSMLVLGGSLLLMKRRGGRSA